MGVSPVAAWVRSVPVSLADPQPAFGSHRPVGLSSSRRTKHRYIYAPTPTPSVLQLHLLPAGHLVVQQQCKACHGSLGALFPTRGVSFISAGQALLHLRSDRRAIWAPSSNFHFICTPTAAPSVLHLDLLPRVTGAASNSASYDKEAVGPSLASGKGVYLVRGLLGVLGRGCCWAGVRG